jgi:hypothetical protein
MLKTLRAVAIAASASTAALALATPASAAVVIQAGAGFVQPAENVLAIGDATGTTVTGATNQTHTSVSVTSLTPVGNPEQISVADSNGQAKFTTADGSLDAARIYLTGGGATFTQAEFNIFNAVGATSQVTIFYTALLNGAVTSGSQIFDIGNGSNYFGFNATGGEAFTSISFDTNGLGVVDLRQVRIGGVGGQVVTAVPEPATWALMLLGFGAMGYSMRRRKQAKALLQLA